MINTPISLKDLEAEFKQLTTKDGSGWGFKTCDYAEAQGIMFLCPKCFEENKGNVGTHSILVWFSNRNVPDELRPKPRWDHKGTGLDDLTISPSILVKAPCGWHGHIKNGKAE